MRAAIIIAVSLLTGAHEGLGAQTVGDLLAAFDSPDPNERSHAFYEFIGGGANVAAGVERALETYSTEREEIATALIGLLRTEDRRYGDRTGFSEADAGYFGDVIWAVATLGDPRALEPLLAVIETGGLARRGVAAFGDVAVPQLTEMLASSEDKWTRIAAAATMRVMMERREQATLARTTEVAIRAALLEALGDTDGYVREQAVRALHHFADTGVRARMRALAQEDEFVRPGVGGAHYPVRDAAKRWLERHAG